MGISIVSINLDYSFKMMLPFLVFILTRIKECLKVPTMAMVDALPVECSALVRAILVRASLGGKNNDLWFDRANLLCVVKCLVVPHCLSLCRVA